MLLAIDVGNSRIHCGLFNGSRLVKHKDIKKGDSAPFQQWPYSEVVMCSVTPKGDQIIKKNLKIRPLTVNHKLDLGLKVRYKYPHKVGADRLANAVAAKFLYGCPSLVIDYGTAITIDVISKKGDYIGGIIVPGLDIMRHGLHERTALLPLVKHRRPKKTLGYTTEDAIRAGLHYGIQGMIEYLTLRLKKELHLSDKTAIINTGGYAHLWGKGIGKLDEFLTLKGLRIIYERNHKL